MYYFETYLNNEKMEASALVYIENSKIKVALPFLSIVKECGGDAKWISEEVVVVSYADAKTIFDIGEFQFGESHFAPPGCDYIIRKSINKEIYLDPETTEIELRGLLNVDSRPSIEINKENQIVVLQIK